MGHSIRNLVEIAIVSSLVQFVVIEPSEPGKDLFFRKFSFALADVKISWGEKRASRQVL